MKKNRNEIVRVISIILIAVLIIPTYVNASEIDSNSVRASYYLTSYNTYLYRSSFGKIRVYFDVTGVDYMDDIGVLKIQIYESSDGETWSWVKTFSHDTTSGMLGHNKIYHSGYVEHSGTIGRYYKAYVCIWAGSGTAGDTRYMWTDIQKASLFAA